MGSIRPRHRADLRDRKISGRHQTTVDGRLLINGVAFGRQSAPAEARPSADFPPRKKRRIERDKHDNSDTMSGGEQMVPRSRPDDENCERRRIDKGYRLAKVSAEDERPSPESAVVSDSTMSMVGDGIPSL